MKDDDLREKAKEIIFWLAVWLGTTLAFGLSIVILTKIVMFMLS